MSPTSDAPGRVSAASAQGERDHQEDRAVHHWIECPSIPGRTGWLLAVFDGHGGAATADKASQALPGFFEMILREGSPVPDVLRGVFGSLQDLCMKDTSGATASIVFIPQNAQEVYFGVLGDSPVAILDAQGRVHIGPDHNVRTNPKELAAAEARGGIYRKGYLEDPEVPELGLQMARTLGDTELSRVLNREPEIETVTLGGKGIVLVGTDGLLFPGGAPNVDQLSRLLTLVHEGADAEALIQDAVTRRTGDNVTAVLWQSVP